MTDEPLENMQKAEILDLQKINEKQKAEIEKLKKKIAYSRVQGVLQDLQDQSSEDDDKMALKEEEKDATSQAPKKRKIA